MLTYLAMAYGYIDTFCFGVYFDRCSVCVQYEYLNSKLFKVIVVSV